MTTREFRVELEDDFGIYAYEVADLGIRTILGVDVQRGESRAAALDQVLAALRARIAEDFHD